MKSKRGFSLVELLVSMLIATFAFVFVMRSMANFETNRRVGTGGSDSMQNGIVALFSLESDGSQAGWGLNHDQALGCTAAFTDSQGYLLANVGGVNPTPFAPVVINASANIGDPDTISFYTGGSVTGSGALPLFTDAAAGATQIDLADQSALGFNTGDVLLLAQSNGTCAIVQASGQPVPTVVGGSTISRIQINGGRYSPPGLPVAYPANAGATRTLVFNLGNQADLSLRTWSIVNNRLTLRASNLAGASTTPQPVVSNIVSIKALYGFDTRLGVPLWPASGMAVTQWSRTIIDADADGVIGNQGDYQRVAAVRLAIVARSREPEKAAPADCISTTVEPTVFERNEPVGVATIPMTINLGAGLPADAWKCYQHRTFEAIVPLRNAGWRPGQ